MESRSVKVFLKGDISDFNRAMLAGSASAKAFTRELDTSNDRTTMLTQSLLAVGPALVPIAAAGVPIISGLTNQLAFAAAGAGAMALAFSGVGDALKATNDYAIDPTEANLKKLEETMHELGPAGRDFVGYLQEIRPAMQQLQDLAQDGLLPGVTDGLDDLMSRLPRFEKIIWTISDSLGGLMSEAGAELGGPEWEEFFTFLETEARPTLVEMGHTLGNFVTGFANLWMAFQPVSANFSKSFLEMSRDFSAWTDGLDETESFQGFIDYLNRVGPKAWDTLGALGGALLAIVEAASPVGEAMLPVIEALAESIGLIAGSDLGPIVIGVLALTSAYARLIALSSTVGGSSIGGLLGKSAMGGGLSNIKAATLASKELAAAQATLAANPGMQVLATRRENLLSVAKAEKGLAEATKARGRQFASAGAGVAGLAFVMSDLDSKMGLSNTAMGVMAGSMAGPWGAAIGGGVGLVMDLTKSHDELGKSMKAAQQVMASGTATLEEQDAAIVAARGEHEAFARAMSNLGFADDEVRRSAEALDELVAARDKNADAARDARLEEAGFSGALMRTDGAVRDQVDAMLQLFEMRNRLADQALAARDAERGYEAAIDAAAKSVKDNGRGVNDKTDVGRANESSIDAIISSWNKMDAASREAKGGIEGARRAVINAAESAGASKKQIDEFVESLNIEPPKPIDIKVNDKSSYVLTSIKATLDSLRDKTINITTNRVETNSAGKRVSGRTYQANGSVLDFFANGGLREQHVAQIAPAGAMRVWAEPETGGEAYIPLHPSKRQRSQAIAMETAQRLGGIAYFANGGVSGGPGTSGPLLGRLVDNTVRPDKNGVFRLIDERFEVLQGGNDNYAATNRRAGRK